MLGMQEELRHGSSFHTSDLAMINNAIEEHKLMKKKISEIPVEEVNSEVQGLLAKLSYFMHDTNLLYLKQQTYSRDILNKFFNPDVETSISKIFQIVNEIHSCRQALLHLWNMKRMKYEQHLQLKLYESDANKMLEWLTNNKEIFMRSFLIIGSTSNDVKELQEKHGEFATASVNVYMNITKLQQVASSMIDKGHTSKAFINQITAQLDRSWKDFSSILDQRNVLLLIATAFYNNFEEYTKQVNFFRSACDNPNIYSYHLEVTELETLVKKIQSFYEKVCNLFNECHLSSTKLVTQLEQLYKTYNVNSGDLKRDMLQQFFRDYEESYRNVMTLAANLSGEQQRLDSFWHFKKVKLHQRLALGLFQDDVRQVLDWINNHGNGFLNKNPGIGKNLAKAKILQKSHLHFETVAQNTYTNAEKLLAAAEELARTGECNSDEISEVARQLKMNISTFAKRVEHRRNILNLAVNFYTLEKEINNHVNEVKNQVTSSSMEVPENSVMIEKRITNFMNQRKKMQSLINNAVSKGQLLLQELKNENAFQQQQKLQLQQQTSGQYNAHQLNEDSYHSLAVSISTIESVIEKLKSLITEFEELWKSQQYKHEVCLKLRLYEKDALNILSQIELWVAEVQNALYHDDSRQFHLKHCDLKIYDESLSTLKSKFAQLQSVIFEEIQYGKELDQLIEPSNFQLMIAPDQSAHDMINKIIVFLQEKEIDVEDLFQLRVKQLENIIQFVDFQANAEQILNWIRNGESMLKTSFLIPTTLAKAESLKAAHEQFQEEIEKTHCRAIYLQQRADFFIQSNHLNSQLIQQISVDLSKKWQNLMTHAEDRHKLVLASISFFKTNEQVVSVLNSLQGEYKREDDFCGANHMNITNDLALVNNLDANDDEYSLSVQITKHHEQKEAFLKACTHARRNAENFSKYITRCIQLYYGHCYPASTYQHAEETIKSIKAEMLKQENHVLEHWAEKKKRLDQCKQYILVEHSSKQALRWINETGMPFIQSKTLLLNESNVTEEKLEQLIKEFSDFNVNLKKRKDKLMLLSQLAHNMIDKGHTHEACIQKWVSFVDQSYANFYNELDRCRAMLNGKQSISSPSDHHHHQSFASCSSSSLSSEDTLIKHDSSSTLTSSGVSSLSSTPVSDIIASHQSLSGGGGGGGESRKSIRKMDYIMAELLRTEKSYVEDLKLCIDTYLVEFRTSQVLPIGLVGKERALFGNIEQIYSFHNK